MYSWIGLVSMSAVPGSLKILYLCETKFYSCLGKRAHWVLRPPRFTFSLHVLRMPNTTLIVYHSDEFCRRFDTYSAFQIQK